MRIYAANLYAVSITVHHRRAFERILVEIEKLLALALGLMLVQGLLQGFLVFLHPNDVVAHQSHDGRVQLRMGQAFYLIDIVRRGQLAAAASGKIRKRIDPAQIRRAQMQIERLAFGIDGEGGMGLIADTRTNMNLIDRVGHALRRRIIRQTLPLIVEKLGAGHGGNRRGNQSIWPLQILVLQRRLINLADETIFVGSVGTRRIEMLGSGVKGGKHHIAAQFASGIGAVPWRIAASRRQQYDPQTKRQTAISP